MVSLLTRVKNPGMEPVGMILPLTGFQPLVHLQNVQAPGQRGDVRARAADPGVRRLQRRSRRRRRRRR